MTFIMSSGHNFEVLLTESSVSLKAFSAAATDTFPHKQKDVGYENEWWGEGRSIEVFLREEVSLEVPVEVGTILY